MKQIKLFKIIVFSSFFINFQVFALEMLSEARVNSYKDYILRGSTQFPRGNFLRGDESLLLKRQSLQWARDFFPNNSIFLKDNLEKASFLSILLLSRAKIINLIPNEEERIQVALECQQKLREFWQIPNPRVNYEEIKKINKLKAHTHIWWAQLSIEIIRQNFDDAWTYLEEIKTPPYSKVARLWQAHLIIRNEHSPTGEYPLDLQWARRIMNNLEAKRTPVIPENEQVNNLVEEVVDMLQNDNIALLEPIIPENNQQINNLVEEEAVLEPIQQQDNNPRENLVNQQDEIHPQYLNSKSMKEMRSELLAELAQKEQELNLLNQTPEQEETDNSDTEDDNDGEQNDVVQDESSSSSEEETDNSDTEDDNDDDGLGDSNTSVDNNIQNFNNFFSPDNHNEIDRLTIEYLKTKAMSPSLSAFLNNKYNFVKEKKEDEFNDETLASLRLIYHYSLKMPYTGKPKKINDEIYSFFHEALYVNLPNKWKSLEKKYEIPNINVADKNDFFRQVLAYRKELKNGSLTKILFLETYNASKNLFRSGGDFSFIDTDVLDINKKEQQEIIVKFKSGNLNFNDFSRNKSAIRSKNLAILWNGLKDEELPKKDLGEIKKAAGLKSFSDKERKFLTDSFNKISSKKLNKECMLQIQSLFYKQFEKAILFRTIESSFETFKSKGEITVYHNFSQEEKNYIKKHLKKRFENNFVNCKEGFYDEFKNKFNRENVFDPSLYALIKECTEQIYLENSSLNKSKQNKKITDEQRDFIKNHLQERLDNGSKTCAQSFKRDFEEKFGKITSDHCYNQAIKQIKNELQDKKPKKRTLPEAKIKKQPKKKLRKN